MKHKILSVSLILALVLGCSALISVSAASGGETSAPETLQAEEAPSEYLLKTEHNMVCVYQNGAFLCSTGIPAASLPQSDRAMLDTGIPAENAAELAALLEDLGS